jgi:hypothetical protein
VIDTAGMPRALSRPPRKVANPVKAHHSVRHDRFAWISATLGVIEVIMRGRLDEASRTMRAADGAADEDQARGALFAAAPLAFACVTERADLARAEKARAEIESLTDELARAIGLGGRDRRTTGATERARTSIQKRLREAIRRIGDEMSELGRHLEQAIYTGMFCGYFPHGRMR